MDLRTMALVSECIEKTAHFVDEEELYLREELAVTRPAKKFVIEHLDHFPRISYQLLVRLSHFSACHCYQMMCLSQVHGEHYRSNAKENSQYNESNTQNEQSTL